VNCLLFGVVGLTVVCWTSCIPLGFVCLFICGIFVVSAGVDLFSCFVVWLSVVCCLSMLFGISVVCGMFVVCGISLICLGASVVLK